MKMTSKSSCVCQPPSLLKEATATSPSGTSSLIRRKDYRCRRIARLGAPGLRLTGDPQTGGIFRPTVLSYLIRYWGSQDPVLFRPGRTLRYPEASYKWGRKPRHRLQLQHHRGQRRGHVLDRGEADKRSCWTQGETWDVCKVCPSMEDRREPCP